MLCKHDMESKNQFYATEEYIYNEYTINYIVIYVI